MKKMLVEIITQSEGMAKESFKIEALSEMNRIKKYSLYEDNYKNNIAKLLSRYVNEYYSTNNIYKELSEIPSDYGFDISNEERIDFVAEIIAATYNNIDEIRKDEQIMRNVIVDTRIKKLKADLAKLSVDRFLKEIEEHKPKNTLKDYLGEKRYNEIIDILLDHEIINDKNEFLDQIIDIENRKTKSLRANGIAYTLGYLLNKIELNSLNQKQVFSLISKTFSIKTKYPSYNSFVKKLENFEATTDIYLNSPIEYYYLNFLKEKISLNALIVK